MSPSPIEASHVSGRSPVEPAIAELAMVEPEPAKPRRKLGRRFLLGGLLAVLAVEFRFAEPYVASALGQLRSIQPWWVVAAVGTQVASMAAFTRVQRRMLAAGGARVPLVTMASIVWAANAVNATLPAGSALSWQYEFRRLRSRGATVPAAGFTLLASGVLSGVTFVVLVVVGAADSGTTTLLVGGAASVLAIAVGSFFWRRRGAGVTALHVTLALVDRILSGAYRLVRRSPANAQAGLRRFVTDLTAIRPRRRDWAVGFGLAGMNWVADFLCLLACCEAVGVPKWTLSLALVVFVTGKSASSLTFLPGGLGVTDAAMVLAFTTGGVPTAWATAGVVLYRLISLVLVVALGWVVCGVAWLVERGAATAAEQPLTAATEPADVANPLLGAVATA